MDFAFGHLYARSLAQDLVLEKLGGRSALEAFDAGYSPREVWEAICEAKEMPEDVRWHFRDEPNKRRKATRR